MKLLIDWELLSYWLSLTPPLLWLLTKAAGWILKCFSQSDYQALYSQMICHQVFIPLSHSIWSLQKCKARCHSFTIWFGCKYSPIKDERLQWTPFAIFFSFSVCVTRLIVADCRGGPPNWIFDLWFLPHFLFIIRFSRVGSGHGSRRGPSQWRGCRPKRKQETSSVSVQ